MNQHVTSFFIGVAASLIAPALTIAYLNQTRPSDARAAMTEELVNAQNDLNLVYSRQQSSEFTNTLIPYYFSAYALSDAVPYRDKIPDFAKYREAYGTIDTISKLSTSVISAETTAKIISQRETLDGQLKSLVPRKSWGN